MYTLDFSSLYIIKSSLLHATQKFSSECIIQAQLSNLIN